MAKKKKHPIDKKKVYKLDMFKQVLPAIDSSNKDFYSNLEDDKKKSISVVTLMRFMSSVTKGYNSSDDIGLTEYYIEELNETSNKLSILNLYKHPELQWKMLSIIGCGKCVNHQWIPMTKQSKPQEIDLLFKKIYPDIGQQELETLRKTLSVEDIKQLCDDLAIDKKDTKKYIDEFKKI